MAGVGVDGGRGIFRKPAPSFTPPCGVLSQHFVFSGICAKFKNRVNLGFPRDSVHLKAVLGSLAILHFPSLRSAPTFLKKS